KCSLAGNVPTTGDMQKIRVQVCLSCVNDLRSFSVFKMWQRGRIKIRLFCCTGKSNKTANKHELTRPRSIFPCIAPFPVPHSGSYVFTATIARKGRQIFFAPGGQRPGSAVQRASSRPSNEGAGSDEIAR